MEAGRRCLSLAKGRRRFVFIYTPGCESALLAGLRDFAERPEIDFDHHDAAVLGYQMGKRIEHIPEDRVAILPHWPQEQVG